MTNILSPPGASRWVADSSIVFRPKLAPSWSSFLIKGGHSPARAAMDDEVLAAQLEDYRKALAGINEDVRFPPPTRHRVLRRLD